MIILPPLPYPHRGWTTKKQLSVSPHSHTTKKCQYSEKNREWRKGDPKKISLIKGAYATTNFLLWLQIHPVLISHSLEKGNVIPKMNIIDYGYFPNPSPANPPLPPPPKHPTKIIYFWVTFPAPSPIFTPFPWGALFSIQRPHIQFQNICY